MTINEFIFQVKANLVVDVDVVVDVVVVVVVAV
jgi:hypothetical protein